MKSLLTIFLLTQTIFCFCQRIKKPYSHSDSVNILKSVIRDKNILTYSVGGYGGSPMRPWYAFVFIISIADNYELLTMTRDSNACVKIYGYLGLYHNNYSNIHEITTILSDDTTTVNAIEGCMIFPTTVGRVISEINDWFFERSVDKLLRALYIDSAYRRNYHFYKK